MKMLHSENDLPAVEYNEVLYQAWYINGALHRENGPAMIYHTYHTEIWCLNGGIRYNKGNIQKMPLSLYLSYLRWELKKNGK